MPMMRWIILLAGVLLHGVMRQSWAAPDDLVRTNSSFIVDVWDTEKGLPQNEVTSLIQANDGYLWFGTPAGLVRFDGVRFAVFDESNTPGLTSSRIIALFEDREANLWVSTETAGIFSLRDGRATYAGFGRGTRMAGACQDASGAVWFHLANGQLWRHSQSINTPFLVNTNRPTDYRGIIAERGGPVWIGADWALAFLPSNVALRSPELPLEPSSQRIGKLDYLLASRQGGYWRLAERRVQKWRSGESQPDLDWGWYPWQLTSITTACEDNDGNLIVGTSGAGIYWFDGKGGVDCISTNQGLSNTHILSLQMDREGDLWVGTDGGGLDRVRRPIFDVVEGSRGLVVQSVSGDRTGGVWIGYNDSPLSYWKPGGGQHWLRLPLGIVYVDRAERVWAGTRAAGSFPVLYQVQAGKLQPVPGATSLNGVVRALLEDRQGSLWVGTEHGLARWNQKEWRLYTTDDHLSSDAIQALAEAGDGSLWIGTRGGGLNHLQGSAVTVIRKSEGGLPSDDIACLEVDGDGVLWVGTDGGGLGRCRDGKWTRYTRENGLASNSISYLIEDSQGFLWLGSNAGLMRIDKGQLNAMAGAAEPRAPLPCRVYGRAEGLPIGECTSGSQPGSWRAPDGKLFFPTIKGLVSVDPAELRPNTNAPPVLIESILVDGQPQPLADANTTGFTIPSSKERLEIQFTSLNFSAPDRARFRYWLENHETGWIEAGDTRFARYTKLPPGQYRFHVTACNEDGVWNPAGTSLSILVLPPFWRTGWFLGTSTACLLAAVAGLVHFFSTQRLHRELVLVQQRESLEKERARIARDIHDQLGASLTQVALLGELVEGDKESPAEVEAHARQISQTARETTRVLDEIVWAVNPSNDTLEGLMTYICKYTQEYLAVAGLHYRLDVPEQLPAWPIPPEVRHHVFLASKEAVTNIVRHAHATEVWVRLRLGKENFTIEIQDNGRGLGGLDGKAAQSRNGLGNMRKRMESIGGLFAIGPAPERGALVCLTAPLGTGRN
jgi:ligand-binding sensor domain-containing protein/signal transduction histidine kinase